jgi:hypothetical protein
MNWFKNHSKEIVLENTLNSIVDDKLKYKNLKKYSTEIENIKNDDRSKHLYLQPNYIFQEENCEKIKKIKKVFLRFDEDSSKKLDIYELMTMFNDNNIPVKKMDLMNLFFKKKEEIREKHKVEFFREDDYEIDFKKLVDFATNDNYQKRFEEFMRMIKNREKKRKIILNEVKLFNKN